MRSISVPQNDPIGVVIPGGRPPPLTNTVQTAQHPSPDGRTSGRNVPSDIIPPDGGHLPATLTLDQRRPHVHGPPDPVPDSGWTRVRQTEGARSQTQGTLIRASQKQKARWTKLSSCKSELVPAAR